ncbi:MAG TPA: hypothetical protein VF524_14065, partial [Polyangia bacterium]
MRPARRAIKITRRQVLPERSRLTVGKTVGKTIGKTVAALRRSREALVELDGQLGDLLTCLRAPGAPIDRAAPDRLASAKAEAA